MTKSKFAFFVGLAIPAFFVFKPLILPGPAVWGDAPYFYPQALRELASGPYAWASFGNNFGATNSFLWIYPLMFLYGLLHALFGLNNDVIIRLLFYIPAVTLSFGGPVLFARYLGFSSIVQFFASLIYALNTYFLLVVDGGQIGVALAYGLFPLVLLHLRKLAVRPSFIQFFGSLAIFSLLVVSDVRFAAIAVFTLTLWLFVDHLAVRRYEAKGIRFLFLLALATMALSLYWLIPVSGLGTETLSADVSKLQLLSLLNSLFLFQPHWPLNEFGKVFPPPFYFAGIPLLVFGGLFWIKDKKIWSIALLVLIFAFLVKGETPPFGGIYSWVVNLPFGSAFRDSTKFFVPLLLFVGILTGITGETIGKFLKNYPTPLRRSVWLLGCLYLFFLVHPAILGNLNGVLAGREFPRDFEAIHQKLAREENFLRTAWFPERSPFAFHTEGKPALDAKYLVDERPLASINVGTFDRLNFIHNSQFLDWFDLLGIRYLFFSGDPRRHSLKEDEIEEWNNLLALTKKIDGLVEKDWGVGFPIYENAGTRPRIFASEKLAAVVGSDNIYEKLKSVDSSFSVADQPFVFFEDGKLDPRDLENIASTSAILVFNEKEEIDLAMSFLQKYFVSPEEATGGIDGPSQWALRSSDEYLRWKYELLVKGMDVKEFDYSKGIAFSSERDEWIYFDLEIPKGGNYVFAARTLSKDKNDALEVIVFNGVPINHKKEGQFEWYIREGLSLKKGKQRIAFKNVSGVHVLNTLAFIPQEDWNQAQQLVKNLVDHFEVVKTNDEVSLQDLTNKVGQWIEVEHEMLSPVRYTLSPPDKGKWIIFTDKYHERWELKKDRASLSSLPLYSMVNGFYASYDWDEAEIVFKGQQEARWGLYFSFISFLLLAIVFLYIYPKREQ